MSNISTKIYSFDPQFFIDNYLNKNLWKKEWPVFEYDGFIFTVLLNTIWTYDMSISLRVTIKKNDYSSTETFFIYLERKDNDILINRRLINAVVNLVEGYERSLIRETHQYIKAQELEEIWVKKLKKTARAFLRESGITNRKLIKYYVEGYLRDNAKNYAYKVMESNLHKHIPHLYIAWLSYVGNDEKLNRFLAEQPKYDASSIINEIAEFKEFLKANNLIGELKKLLSELKEEE